MGVNKWISVDEFLLSNIVTDMILYNDCKRALRFNVLQIQK